MSILVPRLALRNVLRHVRRSLLSGSVIFFGVFFLIFARGFIDGIEYGTVRTQIDSNCAHVRLLAAGAEDDGFDLPLTPRLKDVEPLLAAAREIPGFQAAAVRIRFSGEVSNGRDSLRVLAIGADPAADGDVFRLGADAGNGSARRIEAPSGGGGAGGPGILLGSGIMTLLDLKEGDAVTLVARTPAGAISALDFVVAGVIVTGNPAVDNLHAIVPLASARELLALGPAEATEVAIRLTQERLASGAAAALAGRVDAATRIETWVEATEDVRSLMRIRRRGMGIIVSVLMAIAAAGIANTILMSIYERFREIGTLLAFGFPPSSVTSLFFLEGLALGTIASVGGATAGGLAVAYFQRYGIDLSGLTRSPDVVYPVAEVIYMELTAGALLRSAAFGIAVSAIATILPARRAARLVPVEALRA